jgi:uracil-DNA glycosylase
MSSAPIETLHAEIHACRKCVLSGHIESASPRAWGRAPARYMVIGQAPSLTDSNTEEMYLGPAGVKLRGWLREAGFAEEDFGTKVYMTAVTKCFPGRNPGSSKDRAPSRIERENCRPWLTAQIHLVSPKLVVLFGKMAIAAFLGGKLRLEECIGRAYDRLGTVYAPLPHSSGASTWLNDPSHRAQLARAIELIRVLRAAVDADAPLTEELLTKL